MLKPQPLKAYPLIAMLFVTLLIATNLITPKIVALGNLRLTAGDFVYPLSCLLGIVLTEVYGYALSRRVIWGAFLCNLLVAGIILLAIALPFDHSWQEQVPFAAILGRTPRMLAASWTAFLIGEFTGTYLIAKLKILTNGGHLWLRSSSAILVGQLIDSFLFTTVAFAGVINWSTIWQLSVAAYCCKIGYQLLFTPLIYLLARTLKRWEKVDTFDLHTDFNPFNLGLY